MFGGLKVKGHRRAKPSTPYERPKGVVDKVRRWLSPSSWAGYFGSTSEQSDMETQTDQLPGVALPPSSKATSTDTSGGHLFTPMLNIAPLSDGISVSKPKVDLFLLQDDSPACSSDVGKEEEILPNNSDDSWVAEDLSDEEEDANVEETVLARQSSISLSCGSGMDSSDNGSGYESPSYAYQLGEGEVNVVQHSSLLLTPGAEAPVVRVTNPFFANQLPRVPLQAETSAVSTSVPVCVSHTSQSSYNWSIPRPIGQVQGSQPSVAVVGQSRGSGSVASTYTVTLTKPIMASTVARTAKLPRTPSTDEPDGVTIREKRDKMMFMTTSVVATPSNQTTPSVDRSHMQATVSKSLVSPSSLLTRTSNATDESLRLSPFHSPFYSGRTAYGGAASSQRMRFKRQRSSVEPSICVPVRVKVQPSNTPDKPPSLLSSSAKKILDSLQSSGSPLKDARRLPMRQLSDDDLLPTKRRRVIDSPTGSIVSPPPVTPLRSLQSSHRHFSTPSYSQSLPSSSRQEESSSTRSSGSARVPSEAVSTSASVRPVCSTMSSLPGSSFPSSVTSLPGSSLKLPSFSSSTPKPSSILSGLTFNPVPPAVEVQSRGRSDRDEWTQDKNSSPSSASPGRGTGKVRVSKRSQHHFSRKTGEEEVDVGFVNPLPPPPSVGLKLTTPASFKFHAQSTTPLSDVMSIPHSLSTSMTSSVAPVTSQDSSSFSFSPPKVISSVSAATNQAVSSSFVFSVPKSHVLSPLVTFSTRDTPPSYTSSSSLMPKPATMLGSQTPKLSDLKAPHKFQSNSRGPSLIKPRPLPPIQKQPLPLLSGSVEDVLKSMSKAENSAFKKSSETETTKVGGAKGAKEGVPTKKIPNSSRMTDSSLAKFVPALGSWECDSCMVRNEAKSTSCVACSSPKPSAKPQSKAEDPKSSMAAKFAPPTGSWECESCMVPNKADSNACIACSTPKPGSKGSSNSGSPTSVLADKFAPPASSWECDACMVVNKSKDTKCVACSTTRPHKGMSGVASKSSSSMSFQSTAKKLEKWTCDVCMIINKAEALKCEACTNPKPGSSAVPSKFGSASSGLKLGDGGFKLGGGGLKFGNEGGLKLGFNLGKGGGLKLGSGGVLKMGSEVGGLKLGSESGWKLGSESGLKLGGESGLKLGSEGGLKLGSEGGWSLGSEGGLKLGSGGGLKLGSEGGWGLGSEGGLKLESGGGLKLGSEGGLRLGSGGGLKLGGEGVKLGDEVKHSAGGVKIGMLKRGDNTSALQANSSNSVGLSSVGGSILGSNNPGIFQTSTTSSSLITSGLKLGGGMSSSLFGTTQHSLSSTGAGGNSQTLTSPSNKMEVGYENSGITMKGNGSSHQSQQLFGSSSLTTSSSGLGTGLSLKFGSAQSAPSVSLGSTFSFSATKSSSASTPQGLGGSTARPFVFSGGNPSSSQAISQTSLGINNPLLPSGGSLFQANTAAQGTPLFAFKGASAQSASGPPNVNLFPSGGSLLGSSTSAPPTGKLQGLSFTPVGVSSSPSQPSLQFGSSSTGGLALGGTPGPPLGSGQNIFCSSGGPFQSSQPNVFGSTSSTNVQAPPAFNFGSSIPVLGGSTPTANPSSLPASPVPAAFQFSNQESSGSPSLNFSTASKADLKRRVIKKAARRIRN